MIFAIYNPVLVEIANGVQWAVIVLVVFVRRS